LKHHLQTDIRGVDVWPYASVMLDESRSRRRLLSTEIRVRYQCLLSLYGIAVQMTVLRPSTKLLVVLHVGPLSAAVRNATQQQPTVNNYTLYGSALDVCRQIVTDSSSTFEAGDQCYAAIVTRSAVDVAGSGAFEPLTLVPASTFYVVSNEDTNVFTVCE